MSIYSILFGEKLKKNAICYVEWNFLILIFYIINFLINLNIYSYNKFCIRKIKMEYEIVGAIKIKDGLFLGDEFAA